jgi:hypothetical protein
MFKGPVPPEIQAATGATTWPGVLAWMQQRMASSGLSVEEFSGTFSVTLDAEGVLLAEEVVTAEEAKTRLDAARAEFDSGESGTGDSGGAEHDGAAHGGEHAGGEEHPQ